MLAEKITNKESGNRTCYYSFGLSGLNEAVDVFSLVVWFYGAFWLLTSQSARTKFNLTSIFFITLTKNKIHWRAIPSNTHSRGRAQGGGPGSGGPIFKGEDLFLHRQPKKLQKIKKFGGSGFLAGGGLDLPATTLIKLNKTTSFAWI